MFFDLLQLVKRCYTVNIIKKINGQVLNKPQMRLLLTIPGGTILQIQTDIH